MVQNPTEIKTTTGDRLGNAGFWGAFGAAALTGTAFIYNGLNKLLTKTGALKPSSLQWKTIGVAAAVSAAFGFITMNKGEEKARMDALNRAIKISEDPNNHTSAKEKEAALSKAFDDVWNGKDPSTIAVDSTKFRDKVSAERAQSNEAIR